MRYSPELRLRMQKVIDETVDYYSEDLNRRSYIDDQGCFYCKDGKYCAVGRCLNKEGLAIARHFEGKIGRLLINALLNKEDHSTDDPYAHSDELATYGFKRKYQGLPASFWSSLQRLHDGSWWDKRVKLEREGRNLYRLLCRDFGNVVTAKYYSPDKLPPL